MKDQSKFINTNLLKFYFKYNPNKRKDKKIFNNKKPKDNPFGILKNINFK